MGSITLKAGLNELNIKLSPIAPALATLQGLVIDITTSAPLAGAVVRLWDATGTNLLATAITDNSGFYQIGNINPGTYRVTCEKEGYLTKEI